MKAVVLLFWRLLQWPGVVFVVNIVGQVLVSGAEHQRAVGKAFAWTLATAFFAGTRATAFAKLRTLHMLPNGQRTLMHALALLAGVCTLTAGGALWWVYGGRFAPPTILVFVILTSLALWVFAARMAKLVRLALTLALATIGVTLVAMVGPQVFVGWMWIPVLAALAGALAAWTIMLRAEKLPGSGETRLPDDAVWEHTAHAWSLLLPRSSPTLTLLRSGRAAVTRLPTALMVVLGAALVFHLILGNRRPVDNYPVMIAMELQIVSLLAFFDSLTLAANARLLWLRSGASRTRLFGIAERSLVQYGLVVLAGWAAATGLALSRGMQIDARQALAMLVAMAVSALAPLYVGLMFNALRKWQRAIAGTFLFFMLFVMPLLWVRATGMHNHGPGSPKVAALVLLLLLTLLLRFVTWWAWRRIDWTALRPGRAVLS